MTIESVHPCDRAVDDLLQDCQVSFGRRSGPGGQHRNKVESAVVITHQPTGVTGQAAERRSQHENRKMAVERLRLNLALAVRTERGAAGYRPSNTWTSRLINKRVSVNTRHEDFACCLAEALDVVQALDFDTASAAEQLRCTHSQLIKFLSAVPAAMQWINQQRDQRGLRRLR